MTRLNLVIADTDTAYADMVVGYINEKYAQRFKTFFFSDKSNLINFFQQNNLIIHVLLISQELYDEAIVRNEAKTVIVLSKTHTLSIHNDVTVINKYQSGENIVSSIINTYSEKNPESAFGDKGDKHTKIIGVFSPIGGSGKTIVSLSCAMLSAQQGGNSFYLNLEDYPSYEEFVDASGRYNFSHVLYYIKSNNKNIGLKIEGARKISQEFGFHYFNPPDSIFELSDMTQEEYCALVSQFKMMKYYDVVLIDMTCALDAKNMKLLDICDRIVLPVLPGAVSTCKIKEFLNHIDIIEKRYNVTIASKLAILINKYIPGCEYEVSNIIINNDTPVLKLPKINELITKREGKLFLELNNPFGDAINDILNRLL